MQRFIDIFSGLDIAYGTYRIEKDKGNGKQVGKAVVVRHPPTPDIWKAHLDGAEPALGIIPIRADNSCTWGAIDIDQYPIDHTALIQKIRKLNLPLVVCRSKSGGAHCFVFTKTPVPAADVQDYLKGAASLLGEAGREIFPKQTEILVDRGDTGNFLNLPYFAGDSTLRYAIKDNGESASLEEFYVMYDTYVQDAPLTAPEPPKRAVSPLKDAPPCLQTLCQSGFPEGTRNNGLFNIGIYLRKAYGDQWEDKMLEYNNLYMSPPVSLTEVQLIIKQLKKKTYKYKCKDAPINSFCNPSVCRMRKYGIGADAPDAPSMAALSKYNSEPPLWFLDVNSRRVELDTEQLFNQMQFQRVCMERLNILPPTLQRADWEQRLNHLLREMVEMEQIVNASDDTSITGRFTELLEEFTTHLQQAMDRDEILMGRPWVNEEEAAVYFRMKDLEAHLKRNNFVGLTTPRMAQRIRDLGGEPITVSLKNRATRLWKMPTFKKQDAPFDTKAHPTTGAPF